MLLPYVPLCSFAALLCSPTNPGGKPCSFSAPSEAALLLFLIENGNRQSKVRGVYNVYTYRGTQHKSSNDVVS